MYQGETITIEIKDLPMPVSEIVALNIVFHTVTKTILEKSFKDCLIDGEIIECALTQAESLRLPCGPISVSIIVLTKCGARFERKYCDLYCAPTAEREVLQ